MKRLGKSLCALLFACCVLSSALPQASVTLTSEQAALMRRELHNMRQEVSMLKNLLSAQERSSKEFQSKCTTLEVELTKALQLLESSEHSAAALQQTVHELKTQLLELKAEYYALSKSLMRQKKLAKGLAVTAGILLAAAVAEGVVIWVQSR